MEEDSRKGKEVMFQQQHKNGRNDKGFYPLVEYLRLNRIKGKTSQNIAIVGVSETNRLTISL